MHLLVGIDTEGDNQWDAAARANQQFSNIYALPRLHALFARHGVRPTYVITYPVARDPQRDANARLERFLPDPFIATVDTFDLREAQLAG